MTKSRVNADNVTADIAGITAGTGITGGGTSGTVTITNDMATTIAAKGDILAGTANDAYSALTVGTNGQVLTAASSAATGLEWATLVSGAPAITQIATGNINSGTSVTISSLSSYDTIILKLNTLTWDTSNDYLYLQVNSAATNHFFAIGAVNYATVGNVSDSESQIQLNGTRLVRNTGANNRFYIVFTNCKAAGFTNFQFTGIFQDEGNDSNFSTGTGIYTSAAAVSNLKISTRNGYTFNGSGNYTIWGA